VRAIHTHTIRDDGSVKCNTIIYLDDKAFRLSQDINTAYFCKVNFREEGLHFMSVAYIEITFQISQLRLAS